MKRQVQILSLISLCLGAALLGPSCAGRHAPPRHLSSSAPKIGIYKGRISDEKGRSRRFRLLLYAAMPDRLHGEVVSPFGKTELILDGGRGRLAVAVVADRLAFVGRPGPRIMERLVGVRISLEGLVQALLTGRTGDGTYRLERVAREDPGLPQSFKIEADGRSLRIELKRIDALRASSAQLASGAAPAGFERRSLSELAWEWFDNRPVRQEGEP